MIRVEQFGWFFAGLILPSMAIAAPVEAPIGASARWSGSPQRYLLFRPNDLPPPTPPAPRLRQRLTVLAGGGFGGLMIRSSSDWTLAPAYRLHLGLSVGQTQFSLRAVVAPNTARDPQQGSVSLYGTRASFAYRFIEDAVVHPVAGIGLGSLVASGETTGHAFAVVLRAGLELAYPLSHGTLGLGLDATAHLPFARTQSFSIDATGLASFGAFVDYRF